MKALIEQHLASALATLKADGIIPADIDPKIAVTRTKDPSHGDFASNLAMMLAKPAGAAPRDIAQKLIDALPENNEIREVAIAGPGFINFFQNDSAAASVVQRVLEQGEKYGTSNVGNGQRWQVEYVSANPTGPLHVGHGRGAALGATIANMLNAVGFDVQREYYVNDAGRQMDILAASVWLRYLEACGESFDFPSNGYKGEYVKEIANKLKAQIGDNLKHSAELIFDSVPPDEPAGGDKELHIDGIVAQARQLLGEEYRSVFDLGLYAILKDIKEDLSEFGVEYDEWFSERSLADNVKAVVKKLEDAGHLYVKDGAKWFRTTDFGDEKDRVVVRDNGQTTYFASDIAYIDNKLERGFDKVLYVFGADHHGYTARMYAACEALGHSRDKLDFLLIQFAILYKGGERMQMSTRSGEFVTIRELREEVGTDAARYFYVMRKYQQHLDFDLDLAKSQSNENPVYYVQMAHARICSVLRRCEQLGMSYDQKAGLASLDLLSEPEEADLLTQLATFPELLERAALSHEPHQLTTYLRDLANGLHSYYNAHKTLVDDDALRQARLCLMQAVQQVLHNGLTLIDVSAPEVM